MELSERVLGAFFGHAIGDALGVPVEFIIRDELNRNPVIGFREFGTHNQPAGTWSDDTSLMLCTADAMCAGSGIGRIGEKFVSWLRQAEWTAHGKVFDVGNATFEAIVRLEAGERPDLAGGMDEASNGNGSLMRILPLGFALRDSDLRTRRVESFQTSALTHAHPRSKFACWFFVEILIEVCQNRPIEDCIDVAHKRLSGWVAKHLGPDSEWNHYESCTATLKRRAIETIQSSGYVVHSMEAALWSVLNTDSFRDAALAAVNLGDDSDTTGAIAGGLAGALYGISDIPKEWTERIARSDDIRTLANRFYNHLSDNHGHGRSAAEPR